MENIYESLVRAIVKQQEAIVGPVAWTEAERVSGLEIKSTSVKIIGDGKLVVESLVNQYATLFGKASVEVCKEAVRDMVVKADKSLIPAILL